MASKFSITSGALPKGAVVAGFRGSEGMSRPYVFDVYVNVPGDEEITLEEVIGSKATLKIEDEATLLGIGVVATWSGVFATFECVRAVKGNSLYLARIVPQLWHLTQTLHSRMFTKKKAPDVIKAVLDEEGIIDYEIRVTGTYPEEEHICQYKESSLDFIHRWCEREGIYYFFEQGEDGEKVIFTDDKSKHEAVKTGSVRYRPTTGKDHSAGRHFDVFVARHAALPSSVKLTDYDYIKPGLEITGSTKVSPSGVGTVQNYGNRFFTSGEGARIAKIRAEELKSRGTTYHASGAAVGISPGYTYALEEHPHLSLNKDYLATQVEHFGYVADIAKGWGDIVQHLYDDIYHVDLLSISADVQYRHPSTTPWPRIDGFENGIVDGPASSEYAQIDDQGRYFVKFKFDEGTLKDGKASTYVRMMQPHGGSIEGFHFPLRKGTEVVFIFMGGDPDRPVIAGVVPNAQKPSPVVANNHTQNIIQTGGSNFITIEDLSGSQFINIFCPIFQTNLYLGADRGVGSCGLTTGNGPDAAEKGEYKEEMGPFNFQLATKKNGEVFTQGNLNLIAYGKAQMEGQSGVIEYSGDYWHQHVKGQTEEHRQLKVHHRYDDVVDYDWKGPYTLDVEKSGTLTYKDTYTRTVTGVSTISDKSSLGHFIGCEANMCPADTYYLKVQGTEHHEVSGKVTEVFKEGQETTITGEHKVTVNGEQKWTTTGNVEWSVNGDKKIEATSWHEESITCKSEIILGWKNDMVFGVHTEADVGNHSCFDGISKVEITAAWQLEGNWGPKHNLRAEENTLALVEGHQVGRYSADALEVEFHCAFLFSLLTPLFESTAALTKIG